MKKAGLLQRFPALLLIISLLCTSCGKTKASTMQLMKTEGAVGVANAEGKSIEPKEKLMLYSGYGMATQETSYAWINLDSVKLSKLDENSEIEIQKDGKKLEIQINSGSLFFNVTEPLDEDETLDIHTSTMTVGIRGTCGWVTSVDENHAQVYILEGSVTVTAAGSGETVTVSAGEMAEVFIDENGKITIRVTKFSVSSIPTFVLAELKQDTKLAEEILTVSGLDVLDPPTTVELAHEAYEKILAEYLDAQQNALPCSPYGVNFDRDSGEDLNEYLEEMQRNYEINQANYPDLSSSYLDFYADGDDPLYSAYYDIDGNGTEELFIGVSSGSMLLLEAYAFNGTEAVKLSASSGTAFFDVYFGTITADGLFLKGGNGGIGMVEREGGMTVETIYRLSADGFSLERVTDINISAAANGWEPDLSSHGGEINDLLDWTALDADSGSDTTETVDFNNYLGNYINDQTGVTLQLQSSRGQYFMYTPRPGDPAHLDAYDLEVRDETLQIIYNGSLFLTLTPQNGDLLVESTGEDEQLDHLSGLYHLS